jgi:branched-chain amino acid transport system substrate-binding protein
MQGGRIIPMKSLAGGGAVRACVTGLTLALVAIAAAAPARTAEPIKIGFGMALTGGLSANGKSALLAMKIWEEGTNATGGLLGRPVRLVYYDDQSNPATVPALFTKLLEVDKVDLVVGDYGTNLLAPAMPVIMSHNMTFIGLFGLAVNSVFNYPKYFSTFPTGPDLAHSRGRVDARHVAVQIIGKWFQER